jgi:ATP-dependent DNA helicase RecG
MKHEEGPQLSLNFDPSVLALLTPDEIWESAATLVPHMKEDRRIERKPPRYDAKALGDYFSMWANTSPDGGLIVVGMGDGGEMIGFEREDPKRVNTLEATGPIYCSDARFISKRLPIVNDKGHNDFVLLFRIYYHKSKVVKTASGEAFHRIADRKLKLSTEMIRELEIDKGEIDLELEPAPFKYPEDFDLELIEDFARGWRTARKLPEKPILDILQLSHLGDRTKDGFLPNVACALLFAKYPTKHFPGCRIRFLRFDGEFEGSGQSWNATKDEWIDDGPIPRLIKSAEGIIDSQLRTFSRLGPDGKFYTAPEYPKEAWYEALVNACVHRSYGLKSMTTFIKMFDDRFVVESPGGFPPLVTPENIYETHQPRNPRLMTALFYLDFVKCAHEGTRRMRDNMVAMNLPLPIFQQKRGDSANVTVTFRNNIKQRRVWIDADVRDIVSAAILPELSENDRRAINFVAEHGAINVSQMQNLTGLSWETAKKRLMRLVEMRILDHKIREMFGTGRDSKAHFVLRSGKAENGTKRS